MSKAEMMKQLGALIGDAQVGGLTPSEVVACLEMTKQDFVAAMLRSVEEEMIT